MGNWLDRNGVERHWDKLMHKMGLDAPLSDGSYGQPRSPSSPPSFQGDWHSVPCPNGWPKMKPVMLVATKEDIEQFGLPRAFRTPAYWSPCEVRELPANHISNRVPLDPDAD